MKEKNVDHAGQKNDGGCWAAVQRKNIARGRAHSTRIGREREREKKRTFRAQV